MTITTPRSRELALTRVSLTAESPAADTNYIVWGGAAPATGAWPLANLAIGFPFEIDEQCIAYGVWWHNGATAGGNVDIGIYDMAFNRLKSIGGVSRGTASVTNNNDWADYTLTPGQYYAVMSHDGTSNVFGWAPAAGLAEASGVVEATSSYVLPNPITFAKTTRAYIPNFGISLRSIWL